MFNLIYYKMTKVRLNLRKVATIVACLVVTTMFASCDKKNGDDDNGGTSTGKIDTKLIGEWSYSDGSEHHNYFFYKNGTCLLLITGSMNFKGEAKYSTSDGKIYLTEYYTTNMIGEKTLRIDKVVGYSIGTDERGEYLTTGNVSGLAATAENAPGRKFRRM
jgi:hypothetical protein